MPVLGFIVNPLAGVGGRLALKGSDDRDAVVQALGRGAERVAARRARRALDALRRAGPERLEILAAPGEMGAELAAAAGFATTPLALSLATPTSAADTEAAAAELAKRRVDLLLFAGGDGTARDVVGVVGLGVPVLGIPCGVKMRSGVFGTTPEAAGEAAGRYLAHPAQVGLVEAEVLDAAERPGASDSLTSELLAVARVPGLAGRLQRGKAAPGRADDAALTALCDEIAAELEPGRLYLLGPGTTTGRILRRLGLEGTPLGVDAVRDGALVGSDLDEGALLDLLEGGGPATLILGVVGGQGFLLGRGNQQISPRVLRRIGAENVVVVASADKVLALDPPVLYVDIGDGEGDRLLDGYRRVRVAPERSVVLRVAS